MRLFGQAVHRLRHAVKEEGFCLFLAAVAIGGGNQFLGLRYGHGGEQIWKHRAQRTA